MGTYFSVFFFSLRFSILMLKYLIEKGHRQSDRNDQPLNYDIELSMKPMGVGLSLASRKIIS